MIRRENDRATDYATVCIEGQASTTIASLYAAYGLELPAKQGKVGVALSGGGSRAMVAGIGQLLGLEQLGLLGQVRALSTVSGGSWVGVPWTFRPAKLSDAELLGTYTAPQDLSPTLVNELEPTTLGNQVTSEFSGADILWAMLTGSISGDVPPRLAWQQAVAGQLLQPYGLDGADTAFTYNEATQAAIAARNPGSTVPTYLVADAGRPLLLCNMSLVGFDAERELQVCPVESTPLFTGAMASPPLHGLRGQAIGRGAIESFAFGSKARLEPGPAADDTLSVASRQLWRPTDAMGTSSAFVGAALVNIAKQLLDDPKLPGLVERRASAAELRAHLQARARGFDWSGPKLLIIEEIIELLIEIHLHHYSLVLVAAYLGTMEPRYPYFPATKDAARNNQIGTFVDGGDYDNTGVVSLLRYEDIDTIIAFVNTGETFVEGTKGIDGEPGTNASVSSDIAALFGYMAYDPDDGWRTFAGNGQSIFDNTLTKCQVFESTDFAELVRKMTAANERAAEASGRPVIVHSKLVTYANDYGGVPSGRTVTVAWCVLAGVEAWTRQLSAEVRAILDPLVKHWGFPNYSVFDTGLTAHKVSLLANLSAWSVCGEHSSREFAALFDGAAE